MVDLDYEGEEIILGGKARHIRYSIKGLKIITKQIQGMVKAFNGMQTMDASVMAKTMDSLVSLLHAGLIHEDPKLTVGDVEDMLTMNNMPAVFNAIIRVFSSSTPQRRTFFKGRQR